MFNKRNSMITFMAIAVLAVIVLSGCNVIGAAITGSGNVVSQEYDFTDFEEVDISHAFQGTITQGDAYSIVVRVDDNLVDRLEVSQEGNRVNIGLEETSLVTRATMEFEITMPNLTWLGVSGASQAQLNGFASGDDFTAEASGASRIHGDVATGNLDLEASGASTIALAGTGGDVRANAGGASTIDLEALTAANANVEASGASTVIVNMTGQLNANASGASNIYYLGNPTLGNIDESGGSNVGPR
jgi:hypothetical protein